MGLEATDVREVRHQWRRACPVTEPDPLSFFEPEVANFGSIEEVRTRLAQTGYLADDGISGVVYLADRLAKPVLVEGPAGTGKTELAKAVARVTGSRLIRLQCYEASTSRRRSTSGTTRSSSCESRPSRLWTARTTREPKVRLKGESAWRALEEDIFSEEFLLTRPCSRPFDRMTRSTSG